ncbi:hypothetical protein F2Q70_00005560 [Brassica cretica]|uniref:Retrotransposon gag domain-containing protein n=1 Tax=Brassica cretica TaxID=69181 RepID=A0A8S9ITA6_BRACR|nr:hypothetical protein F2Q70_00005560 [Brassica cretica]
MVSFESKSSWSRGSQDPESFRFKVQTRGIISGEADPVIITPRKSSGPRTHTNFTSSSRFIPEKHHSPAQKRRHPIGVISTCCQIPWHPGVSGQIRSIKKRVEIPCFPRKRRFGRPIFCVHSKGFVSSRNLEKTSDSLYEILQHRVETLRHYVARFNQEKVSIPECNVTTAISAFKRGMLPDGDLYKELTKYQCKTMEDVLSRAWAQVKWEEGVASRTRTQQKQATKQDRSDRDERPSQKPTKDQEGRQMGQQVKCPPKMRAPDSFWNPDLWCEFHRDHGHKTEDCVVLKIEVNELLQKGYLREFLSEKAKNLLSKETPRKSAETKPASPPR